VYVKYVRVGYSDRLRWPIREFISWAFYLSWRQIGTTAKYIFEFPFRIGEKCEGKYLISDKSRIRKRSIHIKTLDVRYTDSFRVICIDIPG